MTRPLISLQTHYSRHSREGGNPGAAEHAYPGGWIPAFAGMTEEGYGHPTHEKLNVSMHRYRVSGMPDLTARLVSHATPQAYCTGQVRLVRRVSGSFYRPAVKGRQGKDKQGTTELPHVFS